MKPTPDRALPSAAKLKAMADGALLAELARTADELAVVDARQKELWAHRVAVYTEGRKRTPHVTQQQLAQVAGVSEVAVVKALKKDEAKRLAAKG